MQILNNEDWVLKGRDASVSIVVIIIIFVLNDNLSLMREDVMTEKIQEEVWGGAITMKIDILNKYLIIILFHIVLTRLNE